MYSISCRKLDPHNVVYKRAVTLLTEISYSDCSAIPVMPATLLEMGPVYNIS